MKKTYPLPSRALSIKPVWAWLIVNGLKPEEYRTWPTRIRERVAVHASRMTQAEYTDMLEAVETHYGGWHVRPVPEFKDIVQGAIIGSVEITGCEPTDDGYAFVLADPVKCEPQPMRGMLGFWPLRAESQKK